MLSDAYFAYQADKNPCALLHQIDYHLAQMRGPYQAVYSGRDREYALYIRQLAAMDSPLIHGYIPIALSFLLQQEAA